MPRRVGLLDNIQPLTMTKGYHNYRGRGGRQKRLLAVVLVLVILAATAFLVIQNYIVYDDAGKGPHRVALPQG